MSLSRRRFQRTALTVLGVLLIVVGATRLWAALGDLFRHDHRRHYVERVEARRGHRHDQRERRPDVVSTAARDELYNETFRVRPGNQLVLDLGSENVTVRTTSGDRARVRVEGRGRDAEREFERRRFSARTDGRRLLVRTNPPRRRWSVGRTDAQFQVTIELPHPFDAVLNLGSGNVQVEDVNGGEIVLDTGSGNVEGRALQGRVRIDTGSGNVRVDRVDGELAVDTGSGGVEVTLRSVARTTVETGSGSVTLLLPGSAGFDVELGGGSVRIDEALGFSGHRERDKAQGQINGGGPRLVVDTGSGSIRLRSL